MKEIDILLINPNMLNPPVTPVGLDCLGSFLKKRGFQVELVDLNLLENKKSLENDKSWQAVLKEYFSNTKPHLIGVSVRNIDDSSFHSSRFILKDTNKIIQYIRSQSSSPVVVGGVGYSIFPESALQYLDVDYGIAGDGEEPLFRLIQAIKKGDEQPEIPGLYIKKGEKVISNKPYYDEIPSILPRPRTFVDNLSYLEMGAQVGLETKRGCNGTCIYCADPVAKGKKIRLKNPDMVVKEIESLVLQGITCFHTCDSEFNRPISHSIDVCDAIIASGWNKDIKIYTYCSPVPFTAELGEKMKKAGVKGINFGADHLVDSLLMSYGRDHTAKDLEKVTEIAKNCGMSVMYDLLLCGPEETEETLKLVIKKAKTTKADSIGISMGIRLYPDTPLWNSLKKDDYRFIPGKPRNPPLEPLYFVKPEKEKAVSLLCDLIGEDRRFFFQPLGEKYNYNYADNKRLMEAIRSGARGAYWDILRKMGGILK